MGHGRKSGMAETSAGSAMKSSSKTAAAMEPAARRRQRRTCGSHKKSRENGASRGRAKR
jgi:hypothetical protein